MMQVYSPDKCCVYYGKAGTFDAQAVNGQAYLINPSSNHSQPYVPVCDDLGAGTWCVHDANNTLNSTRTLTCAPSPSGGPANTPALAASFATCPVGYQAEICVNTTSFSTTWKTSGNVTATLKTAMPSGTECSSKKLPSTYAATFAQFMPAYCDNFAKTMAGVKNPTDLRYFCVGVNYNYILECPTNRIVEKCGVGCVAKVEMDGTACGKAACAAYVDDDSV